MHSDAVFRMPSLRLAEAQIAGGGRAHVYELAWPAPAYGGALGACHGLDVPLLFGTFAADLGLMLFAGVGSSPEAEALSSRFRTAWTAFATTGDPGWPAYDTARRPTQVFDTDSAVAPRPARDLAPPLGAPRLRGAAVAGLRARARQPAGFPLRRTVARCGSPSGPWPAATARSAAPFAAVSAPTSRPCYGRVDQVGDRRRRGGDRGALTGVVAGAELTGESRIISDSRPLIPMANGARSSGAMPSAEASAKERHAVHRHGEQAEERHLVCRRPAGIGTEIRTGAAHGGHRVPYGLVHLVRPAVEDGGGRRADDLGRGEDRAVQVADAVPTSSTCPPVRTTSSVREPPPTGTSPCTACATKKVPVRVSSATSPRSSI